MNSLSKMNSLSNRIHSFLKRNSSFSILSLNERNMDTHRSTNINRLPMSNTSEPIYTNVNTNPYSSASTTDTSPENPRFSVIALIVCIISEERDSRLADVSQSIREEWGSVLSVSGPEILDGRKASLPLCPESYKCDINVESKLLHRNIYEVGVFDAEVNMSGRFITNDVRSAGDSVKLIVYVNPKTITGLKDVVINGKPYKWSKSSDHLFAMIDTADLTDAVKFETSFHSRGSGGICVGQRRYKCGTYEEIVEEWYRMFHHYLDEQD